MKKYLLMSAALFCVSPAFAQDANTITIIQEDGSVDVIDLGGTAAPASAPAPEAAPEAVSAPKPAPVEAVPEASPAPSDAAMQAPKAAEEVEAAPAPKPAPKPAVKPKKKPKAAAPKPKAKPAPEKTVVKPSTKPLLQTIPQGAAITRERALYIALEDAPPASRSEVIESRFEGHDTYSVIFGTEDGDYEVTVDRASGQILQSGFMVKDTAPVKPGHLPKP